MDSPGATPSPVQPPLPNLPPSHSPTAQPGSYRTTPYQAACRQPWALSIPFLRFLKMHSPSLLPPPPAHPPTRELSYNPISGSLPAAMGSLKSLLEGSQSALSLVTSPSSRPPPNQGTIVQPHSRQPACSNGLPQVPQDPRRFLTLRSTLPLFALPHAPTPPQPPPSTFSLITFPPPAIITPSLLLSSPPPSCYHHPLPPAIITPSLLLSSPPPSCYHHPLPLLSSPSPLPPAIITFPPPSYYHHPLPPIITPSLLLSSPPPSYYHHPLPPTNITSSLLLSSPPPSYYHHPLPPTIITSSLPEKLRQHVSTTPCLSPLQSSKHPTASSLLTSRPIFPVLSLPLFPVLSLPLFPVLSLPLFLVLYLPLFPVLSMPLFPVLSLPLFPVLPLPLPKNLPYNQLSGSFPGFLANISSLTLM
ncbi:unnamed protein product [Closterium sp. NIES-65]|nr:unnamed protein product [Closterium sp. NIES-65]